MPPVRRQAGATRPRAGTTARVWAVLVALAMGRFGIGTTEFVPMGPLPDVAGDIGVSTAGHVISAYALGVVAGGPLIAVFAARVPRRRLPVALMVPPSWRSPRWSRRPSCSVCRHG